MDYVCVDYCTNSRLYAVLEPEECLINTEGTDQGYLYCNLQHLKRLHYQLNNLAKMLSIAMSFVY